MGYALQEKNVLSFPDKLSVPYLPDDSEKTAISEDNSVFGLWLIRLMFCAGSVFIFLDS